MDDLLHLPRRRAVALGGNSGRWHTLGQGYIGELVRQVRLTRLCLLVVLSLTTYRDFDKHGPAGPTAFWKVTDDVAEEKPSSMSIVPDSALFKRSEKLIISLGFLPTAILVQS